MRVLLQARTTLFSVPGGDTIQLTKTAERLRDLGCEAVISTELEPCVSSYDIVHVSNLSRPQETYLQVINAKKAGKKVALSTIYVSYSEYERMARGGPAGWLSRNLRPNDVEYLKVLARCLKNREINKGSLALFLNGFTRLQREILSLVDILLPNSHSEESRVFSDFPEVRALPSVIVPNGIDEQVFNPNADVEDRQLERFRGSILCVARIEGLKNQLNLVRATKGLDVPLVLIGNPAPNHKSYFEQVLSEAGRNVHHVSHVSQQQLRDYYSLAKVHCLISWMETTGLSSLEAGAMGCNIVITNKGDTRDYFGDDAFYCEPDDIASIREAVVTAYQSPQRPSLQERIQANYTWAAAAVETLRGYKMLIDGGEI